MSNWGTTIWKSNDFFFFGGGGGREREGEVLNFKLHRWRTEREANYHTENSESPNWDCFYPVLDQFYIACFGTH